MISAAYQNFEDKDRGSIEASKYADTVIILENIAKIDPMSIKNVKFLKTIVEGNSIYQDPN